MSKNSRKQVEEAVRQKAKAFAAVFNSREGRIVLESLKNEFCKDELRAETPHDTYYNLGRRDTVVYIEQMIRYSEREDEKDNSTKGDA